MTIEKTAANQQGAEKVPQLVRLRDTDQTVSSSDEDIRGRMAKDKDGRDLGTIEGLLIDEAERKVRFMEVASGGFLGLGESKSLIPVDAITRMTPDAVYSATPASTWPAPLATTQTWSRPGWTTLHLYRTTVNP